MKTLGIYTSDFSLYHDLIQVLRRRKIPFFTLSSVHRIPNKIRVIITSHNELHDIKFQKVVAADTYDSLDHAVDIAVQMLIGKDMYSSILIGVDPGEKPGIAVIGDGILLQKIHADNPEKTITAIKRFLKEYPAAETIIRIGHGSITIRNRIINSLISLKIPIEVVDETKTTASQQKRRSEKDAEAAAAIALLSGQKVMNNQPLKPTKGEIRDIQRKSRDLSDGKYSISAKMALKVLQGEISLQEAIEMEKKCNKPKCL